MEQWELSDAQLERMLRAILREITEEQWAAELAELYLQYRGGEETPHES